METPEQGPEGGMLVSNNKVSVIVPAYNGECFVDSALSSVLGQIEGPAEVVLVNDCSTDGTLEAARRWESLLPLTIVDKAVNGGLGAARRSAIDAAMGDTIALLDVDDVWLPEHLAATVPLLDDPSTIVTPSILRWYPGEKLSSVGSTELFPIPPADEQLHRLIEWNFLFSGSVFSRAAYEDAGGFSERRKNEDWELWIRMLANGCVVVTPSTPTVLYRHHDESLSSGDGCLDHDIEMYEELLQTFTGSDRAAVVRSLRRRRARKKLLSGLDAYVSGETTAARQSFVAAAITDRSLRGGLSSRSGSVFLRSVAAMARPEWAARKQLARNTDPRSLKGAS